MENSIDTKLQLLVKDIIAKKELRNLDDTFVREKAWAFLKTHPKTSEKFGDVDYSKFKRSKEYKELIKSIRGGLREVYGVFIMKDYNKRRKLLEELKKNPSKENHDKILALHKSSKERLPYYGLVYKKIFEITGQPKRIVDFACGLNPFSYPYLGCASRYLASDLAGKDLEFINDYFKSMKIEGKTKRIDLIKDEISEIAEEQNVVFLFKTLDSLEAIKKNISRDVLRALKAKFIIVSFSTKSLGGKVTIKKERRAWFEKLMKHLGYTFKTFEIPDEIFYIITK